MGPRKLTVTIYRDVNVTGVYPWSPFVAKLETRLRFSLLPYSVQGGSLSDSPKSKLPYARIEDEKEGASSVICDSTLITRTLIELGLIEDLNVDLSPTPKAMDLALRALLEDKLYFITTLERWTENFYVMRDQGPLSRIPYPIRLLVGWIVHSKICRTLYGQGTGRYTAEELDSLGEEAWSSLDDTVAASPAGIHGISWVLGGDNPTEADACLYGFLASSLTSPANPTLKSRIQGLPHLFGYANKVHDTYFPDYQKWT